MSALTERSKPFSSHKQAGWILLELTLCLFVLALVIWLMMRQTESDWSNLQLSQAQRGQLDNLQKAQLMQQLTGQDYVLLLEEVNAIERQSYPNCLECREENLRAWFKASLQAESSAILEDQQ